ncbi:unnamed protein product [Linum tenue]|uniref:FAD-binding PCMH-type domain-containing protein n=1 Tax=Linum tenue TaxID=586396 RepID=A0AAV0QPG7_9ROSI|nr:unnamed protein product [Linum tenue]
MLPPLLLLLLLLLQLPHSWSSPPFQTSQDFTRCLFSQNSTVATHTNLIYTPASPKYSLLLQSTIRDARFNTTLAPKPSVIVTPTSLSQIQASVHCSREHGLQLRVRSGGHDYEGLSYTSPYPNYPFVVLDLVNFRNISVDVPEKTAWVQSGAILGELYHRIGEASPNLAFPAGSCHTVGVGGHFSGGGFGFLMRKFGLAADNVLDAVLIDSKGSVLDRASMGEDMFWAIRGGGGNSFGIVLAWKVRLVSVPSPVTVFRVIRTLEQNALEIVHRWQSVASKLPKELMIELAVTTTNSSTTTTTIRATFNALFQGRSNSLVSLMQSRFPDLGLRKGDCQEMSWLEAMVFHAGFPSNSSVDVLLDRTISPLVGSFKYKSKSDYVQDAVPKAALLKIWGKLFETDVGGGIILMALTR